MPVTMKVDYRVRDFVVRDGFLCPLEHVQSHCDFKTIFLTFVSLLVFFF